MAWRVGKEEGRGGNNSGDIIYITSALLLCVLRLKWGAGQAAKHSGLTASYTVKEHHISLLFLERRTTLFLFIWMYDVFWVFPMKKRDFNREIFQFLVKYFEITYHLSYKNIWMFITSTSFFLTLYSPGIYITITSFSYNIVSTSPALEKQSIF